MLGVDRLGFGGERGLVLTDEFELLRLAVDHVQDALGGRPVGGPTTIRPLR